MSKKICFVSIIFCVILQGVVGQWPCPDTEAISPCICIYTNEGNEPHLLLDCSAIQTETELSDACNAVFPFPDFNLFVMRNAELTELKADTFQSLSFIDIDISTSNIESVEPNTFDGSFETLETLIFSGSKIQSFPYDFSTFGKLVALDLTNNKLQTITLKSSSLVAVNLNNNDIDLIYFDGLQKMETLDLENNDLDIVPSIIDYPKLKYFGLAGNDIHSLGDDAFGSPRIALEHLILSSNGLEIISPTSFLGLFFTSTTRLDLSNNSITKLDESNWGYFLKKIIPDGVGAIVDLTENPLQCGCDVTWLLNDETVMAKLNADTTCASGDLLSNIDPDILASFC